MKKYILILLLPVALLLPTSPAEAMQPPAKCRVISVTKYTETQAVSNVYRYTRDGVKYYARGTRSHQKVTTTSRCRGKIKVTVTYTPWVYRFSGSVYTL